MGAQAGLISAENLHERLAIRNPKDELGQLAERFNSLLDRLDRSFDQQKRFVADASHELRTPVAILCGETEVTLSHPVRAPEEYRESLAILGAEARRLKHIVEDLFTLARADAGQHPLVLTDFYLDELAGECVRSMRTLAAAKQISLHLDAPSEMPIHADESLLRRMVLNLLDNAIKYTPAGGEVHIRCEHSDAFYQVAVRDNGQGVPSELHARIFERFFRVDKARSRSGGASDGSGAGLGLSISSWIAASHGGKLDLTSSTPEGSTFTISLPKTAAER
jgi:signal transduction histidine kinase